MKKHLLLAAIAATCLGASAQTFGEIFQVTDEKGNVLENGSTIVCETYFDKYEGLIPGFMVPEAVCHFYARNINEEPYQLAYEFYRSSPVLEEVPAGEGGFGDYQACYTYFFDGGIPTNGNCTDAKDGETKYQGGLNDVEVDQNFEMAFHQIGFTNFDPLTIHFTYYVIEADEKLEGAQFDLDIKFTHTYDITNGVTGIDAENGEAEYFNMLGTRVANPVKGELYIVRQGGKTAKVIL